MTEPIVKCHQKCSNFKPFWWCVRKDDAIKKGDYSCCKDFDAKEAAPCPSNLQQRQRPRHLPQLLTCGRASRKQRVPREVLRATDGHRHRGRVRGGEIVIIGIDPGPKETAYAIVGADYVPHRADKVDNEAAIALLKMGYDHVAIETIQSYGMAVGREVFDTCFQIGRMIQVCIDNGIPYSLYPRPEYTRRICGVGKINDSILRQSLLLRFGGDGKGEPLNCLKGNSDKRSAYAVAVYHIDKTNFVPPVPMTQAQGAAYLNGAR